MCTRSRAPKSPAPRSAPAPTGTLLSGVVLATARTLALHAWSNRILDRNRHRYWDQCLHRLFATYGK
ncbi:hypothetical protein [Rhodococcus opacus]|uniref:hypothetical protein n=1 Tax=Rhodococcus opacus TaxID=37919 RepID=UPI001056E37D|nr:hypothetical protein [Rhodococcus opacus]